MPTVIDFFITEGHRFRFLDRIMHRTEIPILLPYGRKRTGRDGEERGQG